MAQELLRVFIDPAEREAIGTRSRDELDASPADVVRTLLRMWMAEHIEVTAEDMVKTRGRNASAA